MRPPGHDLGDVLLVDLLLEHARRRAPVRDGLFVLANLPLEVGNPPVLQFGRLRVVARPLCAFHVEAQLFELFLLGAYALDGILLVRPLRGEAHALFLQVRQLALEPLEPLLRRGIGFLAQGLALDLELHDAPTHFVELGRHRVDLHAQARSGLVDQVDGLVGQEPVGDVAVREHGSGHKRRVLELHAVMDLVALAQSAQDADGVLDGRLADLDRLKPAFERRVLLDVLAVLVDRRRANRVQLTPCEHGLEQVRGIDRPFGRPRAHHRVELVDEEDHLPLRVGHFLQHGLQPFLELAAILGTGDQRTHVERDDLLVAQAFRDVAPHDALRQAFDNGRLADAGLADQHGIVLRASGEHLDDAANLVVATDDRVELALARHLGEIAPVPLECLVLALGIGIGHALRTPYGGEGGENRVGRHAQAAERGRRRGAAGFGRKRQQQVLGTGVLVAQLPGAILGGQRHGAEPRRRSGLRAAMGARQAAQGGVGRRRRGAQVHAHLGEHRRHDAVRLLEQRQQQVLGCHLRMTRSLRQLLARDNGFLRLLGVLVQVHVRLTAR